MTVHTFGDTSVDVYGKFHWPCSCGIEATGYNLLDLDAGRVVHLRGEPELAPVIPLYPSQLPGPVLLKLIDGLQFVPLRGIAVDYPGDTGPKDVA